MVDIIAHRGARSLAPENTLASARIAYDLGADLWETDVNLTKDDHLILCHDKDLTRCSDVEKKFPNQLSYLAAIINQYLLGIMQNASKSSVSSSFR